PGHGVSILKLRRHTGHVLPLHVDFRDAGEGLRVAVRARRGSVRADRVLARDDVGELEGGIGPEVAVAHTRETEIGNGWVAVDQVEAHSFGLHAVGHLYRAADARAC